MDRLAQTEIEEAQQEIEELWAENDRLSDLCDKLGAALGDRKEREARELLQWANVAEQYANEVAPVEPELAAKVMTAVEDARKQATEVLKVSHDP